MDTLIAEKQETKTFDIDLFLSDYGIGSNSKPKSTLQSYGLGDIGDVINNFQTKKVKPVKITVNNTNGINSVTAFGNEVSNNIIYDGCLNDINETSLVRIKTLNKEPLEQVLNRIELKHRNNPEIIVKLTPEHYFSANCFPSGIVDMEANINVTEDFEMEIFFIENTSVEIILFPKSTKEINPNNKPKHLGCLWCPNGKTKF